MMARAEVGVLHKLYDMQPAVLLTHFSLKKKKTIPFIISHICEDFQWILKIFH